MDHLTNEWHIPPLFSGQTDVKDWEKHRRPELMKLLSEEVYGITPKRLPDRMESIVIEENPIDRGGKNHYKKILLELWFGEKKVDLELEQWTPHGNGPFPVQIMIDPFAHALFKNYSFYEYYQFFPSDFITDRGYAAIKVNAATLCMDTKEEAYNGLLSILDGSDEGIKEENRWGAIGVWAWAGSRCVDYAVTQSYLDETRIALSGMSRAGKAALWCCAQDQRIAVVISNVSGMGGSAITRGKTGEHIRDITTTFPYWFCKKFSSYSDREDSLPTDSHMLLAMAAPRPMYMASASLDIWADIYAEYKGLQLSMEAYRLYYKDLYLPDKKPDSNMPIHYGPIGYHTREGIHDLTYYDWNCYLDFCNNYLK